MGRAIARLATASKLLLAELKKRLRKRKIVLDYAYASWHTYYVVEREGNTKMVKTVVLNRNGETIKTQIRQMPHDEPVVIGKKIKYGSGPMWLVVAVRWSLADCN